MADSSTSPRKRESFDGFILGTSADDAAAMNKFHQQLAKELGIINTQKFIAAARGRTTDEILSNYPDLEPPEVVKAIELHIANSYGKDIRPIGGLNRFLEKLHAISLLPEHLHRTGRDRCAIVTNASGPRAAAWLKNVGINNAPQCVPPHLPGWVQGYMDGRALIGLEHRKILAIVDNAVGIEAARAAGCQVVGIRTSTNKADISFAKPDWVVEDLEVVADSVIPIKEEEGTGIEFGIWLPTNTRNWE
ncbi:hypothetical protein FQN50_007374 [Emmonsiellopsis sp. PD_5]|nr:hypothetical protein FQN50_007374 [Emmonsiellopsis sp. PD_5]